MALPKRRISKSRKGMRRAHHGLTAKSLALCPRCNQAKLPHAVCENCGHYKGREIVQVEGA